MGDHTKHGGYVVNYDRVRTYVVPQGLKDFKVCPFVCPLLGANLFGQTVSLVLVLQSCNVHMTVEDGDATVLTKSDPVNALRDQQSPTNARFLRLTQNATDKRPQLPC